MLVKGATGKELGDLRRELSSPRQAAFATGTLIVCQRQSNVSVYLCLSNSSAHHIRQSISETTEWFIRAKTIEFVKTYYILHISKQFLFLLFHNLMPHIMIILYFRLPFFNVPSSSLFSTEYFSTLILYRRSLDAFYWDPTSIQFRFFNCWRYTSFKWGHYFQDFNCLLHWFQSFKHSVTLCT